MFLCLSRIKCFEYSFSCKLHNSSFFVCLGLFFFYYYIFIMEFLISMHLARQPFQHYPLLIQLIVLKFSFKFCPSLRCFTLGRNSKRRATKPATMLCIISVQVSDLLRNQISKYLLSLQNHYQFSFAALSKKWKFTFTHSLLFSIIFTNIPSSIPFMWLLGNICGWWLFSKPYIHLLTLFDEAFTRFVRRSLYAHPVVGLSTEYVQVLIKIVVSTYHTSSLNPCFKNILKYLKIFGKCFSCTHRFYK